MTYLTKDSKYSILKLMEICGRYGYDFKNFGELSY